MAAEVLMAAPCTKSLGCESGGHKHGGDEGQVACFAGSSPPFLGRERAAVDVDVGPERRSPRYHETVLLLRVLKTAARRYVNRDVCVTGCACCVVQNVRKRSSPGARVETTGAAARNESAR